MSFDSSQPFTRAQARAAGVSDWALRSYQRLFTDCYLSPSVAADLRMRTLGALLLAPPGSVAARHTSAVLMGGAVPDTTTVHLGLRRGRLRVTGIDARPYSGPRVARARGLPVVPAEETFVELAEELGLVDLVVLGDSLVRAGRATPESLVNAAVQAPQDVRFFARRAASLVRSGVDSPQETRLRLLMVLAGLPEPEVNVCVYDEAGNLVRRYDTAFKVVKVAVEYDGRQHAEDDDQWEHDVARREDIDDEEWRLVVVLSKGIYREPGRTLQRVVRVLRSRGMDVGVRSDEWRLHFPTRHRPGRRHER